MDATKKELSDILHKHSDHCLRHIKIWDKNIDSLLSDLEKYVYDKKQQSAVIPETNESLENLAQYDANHVEKYTSNH